MGNSTGGITLIHSADFHLGRGHSNRFPARAGLRDKTAEHHRLLLEAFQRVAELAREQADVWLIVGDLLDAAPIDAHVTGGLAERVVGQVLAALDASPRLHVVLIAGNHDQAVEYDSGLWRRLAAHERVRVVREPKIVTLDGPGINIVALPWTAARPVQWRDWPASGPTIAAAHCCFPEPLTGPQDFVLTAEEVQTWPVNYVALGHYHSGPSHSLGDKQVVYAGAPEIIDVGERGKGRVARVLLGRDGSVTWEPVPLGQLTGLGSQEWQWQDLPEPRMDSLRRRLTQLAAESPNAWLRVRLKGRRSSGRPLDLEEIQAELRQHFFLLDLIDETDPPVDVSELRAGEGETVLRHFLEIGREELAAAEAELERARTAGDSKAEAEAQTQVEVLREALLLGYSILSSSRESA
ncbi:MAG: metallophosphoesterase [Armatimonadetes bacterium]|nr:metallophosphoesterase [Armatimonadota bacterium]